MIDYCLIASSNSLMVSLTYYKLSNFMTTLSPLLGFPIAIKVNLGLNKELNKKAIYYS